MAGATPQLEQGTVVWPSRWTLSNLAGRFVEISSMRASASLTLTFGLVLEAQRQHEPVAWTTLGESTFYPPDVAEFGIDLDSLVVVRLATPDAIAPDGA